LKRFLLVIFILFDVLLITGGIFGIWWRLTKNPADSQPLPLRPNPPARVPLISTDTVRGSTMTTAALPIPAANDSSGRKILFSYRNPKAKKVAIRADFNGWKAEPMQKDARGVWTYQAALTPGEYAYCFAVDDKITRDPANKRTKRIGETSVSSIVVQPLAASR
jgi:1,4-alpha-glucan branching enzyme